MFVRLATQYDEDIVVELARLAVGENQPTLLFDEQRCRESFAGYLRHASPTIFVVDQRGHVVGFMLAEVRDYRAVSGFFTIQEVLYVQPDKRGTRAAALLIKQLVDWSIRLGAKEIIGGNDGGKKSGQMTKFLERFGFQRVGNAMKRVVDYGW